MDTVEYAHAQAVERKLDDILKLLHLINSGKIPPELMGKPKPANLIKVDFKRGEIE